MMLVTQDLPTSRVSAAVLALAAALAFAPGLPAQQRVQLPAQDRALNLPTRMLFQVGELEGEDYENFASVQDVAFDSHGNLYVLDATAFRVILFDPTGKYVRTIGRQGDGPGEFGLPMALAVLPNGELIVNDAAQSNLQVFGPDGTFRRTIVPDEPLGRVSGRMRVSPKGGLITETMPQLRPVNPGARGTPQRMQLPPRSVTRVTIGDSLSGTRLFSAAARDVQLSAPRTASGGAMRVAMSITAFEPGLLWTPTADGGAAALNTAPYRITVTDPAGRAVRFLERPIQPRKTTQADRKRFLENQKQGIPTGGSGGMIAFAARGGSGTSLPGRNATTTTMRMGNLDLNESDVTWSDVIPVISALGTDSYRRLWVQRTGPDLRDGPIDIIDSAYRYLGTLPQQAMPRAFGPGGRLAYLVKDDLDVQRVVVEQLLR